MKIAEVEMSATASLTKEGRTFGPIGVTADRAELYGVIPGGNRTRVRVRFNQYEIAAAAEDNTTDARIPAPKSPVGQPTTILSRQVE